MTNQAYDEQNQLDYDDYTQKLEDALKKISEDPNLKATIQQVSALTGISRGTVSDRGFPKERLKEIKEERKRKKLEIKKQKRSQLEIITEERDKLAKEVGLWFSEYTQAKRDRDSFEIQLKRALESGEFYKKEFIKQKESILTLEAKNEQLNELIRDLNK